MNRQVIHFSSVRKTIFIALLCLGSLLLSQEMNAQADLKGKKQVSEQTDKKTTKLELTVAGMSCQAGCADGIDHLLSGREGVVKSNTTYATGISSIWYDQAIISEKEIIELIGKRGFKATVKTTQTKIKDQ